MENEILTDQAKKEKKPSVKERIVIIANELRVQKKGHNEFTKSGYFQPDDVLAAINPLLLKYRIIAEFDMEYSKEIEMYRGTLVLEDFDNDEDDRRFTFDIPMTELKGTGKAQNAGATQTYCKRYMFMNVFNLADNKADPDNKDNKNKPADSKPKATVAEILEKIKATKTQKDIETWKAWIPASGYNDTQKNLMLRTLEETNKKFNGKN